jgi:hypothetical protein
MPMAVHSFDLFAEPLEQGEPQDAHRTVLERNRVAHVSLYANVAQRQNVSGEKETGNVFASVGAHHRLLERTGMDEIEAIEYLAGTKECVAFLDATACKGKRF